MRILFCGNTFPDAPEYLRNYLAADSNDEIIVCPDADILPSLTGVDVVIPKMQRIGSREIEAGTFRLVQQWGAGVEGIDLPSAQRKGIYVSNVPAAGGNADAVAEHAMLLILSLLRNLRKAQAKVAQGIIGAPLGKSLSGLNVCLYGLGGIALPLAKRLKAFHARLTGISRNPSAQKIAEFGLSHCFSVKEQDEAFATADILVLCMKYTDDMRGMIGMRELGKLPRGAYIVNVARGGVIDGEALYKQLSCGHLAGAGLDVFWQEPLPADDPILTLPTVVATPHIGGVTESSFRSIAESVAANIERLRHGQVPLHVVF